MAKIKKIGEAKPRVNFPLVILPRDNQKKTLPQVKQARESAENIYYPTRKPLYDLYREVLTDPHVVNCIEKRVNAITNCTWAFGEDGVEVPEVETILKKHAFEKILRFVIESKIFGFSLIEVGDIDKGIAELVPREHVIPQYGVVVADPYILTEGLDFTSPPYNRTTMAVGDPEDLGLLLNIAPYAILKKGDIADWATYCEIYGSPLRVGKYDPTMPGNEAAVTNGLKNMGNNAWAALPQGSDFEFIESSKGTGNNIYESFAKFCDDQISLGLVGQTMTSKDGSSQAQAKVHQEVLEDINMSDRRFVEKVLNENFIPILQAKGIAIPKGAEFTIVDEEETLTKKDRLEMDLQIHKEVKPLKVEYFAQEYNVEFDDAQPSRAEETNNKEKAAPSPVERAGVRSKDNANFLDHLKSFFQ